MDDIDNYFASPITNIDDAIKDEIIIGIDLGTTNSCVAIWRKNNLEIITDMYGNRTIPSVVAYSPKSKYVGNDAKKQVELNPENTFYEVKRLIGRKFDDETVKNDQEFLSYTICPDDQNNVILKSKNYYKTFITPEEIASNILMELKHMAENYLNQDISKVVVTVPAYFGDSQRQATKDACQIAGLECVRIINEPTAAALAYGFDKRTDDVNIIIYDLGGGTLDVSLLNVSNGIFQVLGSSGNTHLGGADFDNFLMSYSIEQFKLKYKLSDIKEINPLSYQKLKQSCENAKKRLSEIKKTTIVVPKFYDDKDLMITITEEIFNNVCKELFMLCLKPVSDILKSCGMKKKEIDEIILVGGCTRMPQIRNNLQQFFNGKEPNCSVNPDEVVAAGAAIQGFIIGNKNDPFSENITLLDIIPLSLGVEIIGGVMNTIIPRNSIIPITKKRRYTNDTDNETYICIKIFEGERKLTRDNYLVGEFELTNIEPCLRGINQFEITFSVDVNGIINVTALDLINTDNKKTVTLNSNKGRLSADKIKELVEDAKNNEIIDKIEKMKRSLYYNIEDMCHTIKTNVENVEFKIMEKDKIEIFEYVDNILDDLKKRTYIGIDKKSDTKLLNNIKAKYGTLVIKCTSELDNLKSKCEDVNASSVFGDGDETENDGNKLYDELENLEMGIRCGDDDETKKELKRLRELLVSLCYSVLDVLNNIVIDEQYKKELCDYIDDALLWVYVKEKLTINDYKQKIDEINNICNEIVEKNVCNVDVVNDYGKSDLEQLCFSLLGSIVSGVIGGGNLVDKLKEYIEMTLELIVENTNNGVIDESIYYDKVNIINNMCNEIHNNMGCHYVNNNVVDDDSDDEGGGMTIADLMKKHNK